MPRKTIAELAQQEPKWFELYRVLNDASLHILASVINRKDVPEDAKHLLKGVYVMRDLKDFYTALGTSITPELAVSWADELVAWSKSSSAPATGVAAPPQSSPLPERSDTSPQQFVQMVEVSAEEIPCAPAKPGKKPRKTVPRPKAPQSEASLKNQPQDTSP